MMRKSGLGETKKAQDDPVIEILHLEERRRLLEQLTPQSEDRGHKKTKIKFKFYPNANDRVFERRKIGKKPITKITYTDSQEFGDEFVYVCQKPECNRFMVPWQPDIYPPVEQNRWFVARSQDGVLYVRCPQHIDEWVFSKTAGNIQQLKNWAQKVQKLDKPTADNWDSMTPYPLDPSLVYNTDGTLKIKMKIKRVKHEWTDEGKWV